MDSKLWAEVLKFKPRLAPEVFTLLSKYKARATYTRGLINTKNDSLGTDTTESYFVFLKLALAYTALELLIQAVGRANGFRVFNYRVSYAIAHGRFRALTAQIIESTPVRSRDKVLRTLTELEQKSGNLAQRDLLPFIGLCRHLMFHGAFSPSGAGLVGSKIRRELLLALAGDALNQSDAFLASWIRGQWLKSSKVKGS